MVVDEFVAGHGLGFPCMGSGLPATHISCYTRVEAYGRREGGQRKGRFSYREFLGASPNQQPASTSPNLPQTPSSDDEGSSAACFIEYPPPSLCPYNQNQPTYQAGQARLVIWAKNGDFSSAPMSRIYRSFGHG